MHDWQLLFAVGCVAGSAAYLARRSWRTWSARGQGCTGCGCAAKRVSSGSTAPNLISTDDLTARLRRRR